jgi:hypothetical protein
MTIYGWTKDFCYTALAENFDFANSDLAEIGITRLSDGRFVLIATAAAA